ncbi:cadherin-like domain-containing protein, partial [Pseudomonas mohnii]|uniref:cadherin-like domain-containing protein n=1 Tax=Pseudomonas mohnii TaxID=395600 RepID=UPI0018C6E02E
MRTFLRGIKLVSMAKNIPVIFLLGTLLSGLSGFAHAATATCYKTTACPAGMTGSIEWKLTASYPSNVGSGRNFCAWNQNHSGFKEISNTCVSDIPANTSPVAHGQTLTMTEDTAGVGALFATDADGNGLTYSLVSAPNSAHGSVAISGDKVTFTPSSNWNGTTSFTYRAHDGALYSNTATVTVTVIPVNDPPSVSNATLVLDENSGGTLPLDVTDVDLNFEGDSHSWSIVTAPNPAHGTASIAGNKLTFTPVG